VPSAARPASLLGPQRFRFLNDTRDLEVHGWDDPRVDKLWRYNLHYFDDLNARDAEARLPWQRALLERWVRENPPAKGTGWEPYPTSLRIVNWIKWAWRGNALPDECAHSLAIQVRWLSRRLETHLLGNHLFVNAKALVMAGLFFGDVEAARWVEQGMRILAEQVPEQILPDGGQFELSPMYHALALEDMLDLVNGMATAPSVIPSRWHAATRDWPGVVASLRRWLAAMCHPDGAISFFNDAAIGIAASPAELEGYARRLGCPDIAPGGALVRLSQSGYVRVERGPAVALLDVALVGPDYLPAHAHADTLSFELSLFGTRVLVNSGTSRYGSDAERQRQRGTAAHNTVIIDGENSSEVWSGFRVGRRGRPVGLEVTGVPEITVRCSHDGYRRLPGQPLHTRQWSFDARRLVVNDSISGVFREAQARYHLHPSITVHECSGSGEGGAVDLRLPGGEQLRVTVSGGRLGQERTTWHPEFGMAQPNLCLAIDFTGPSVRTEFAWDPGL